MFGRILIFSAIIMTLLIASAFADQPQLTLEEKITLYDGIQLFKKHCSACHGDNARGGRAPDLMDGKWTYGGSDDDIYTSISEGRSAGRMPQMKGRLDEEQIRKIIAFLRTMEARYRESNS